MVGRDIYRDRSYINLYTTYEYRKWEISISNSQTLSRYRDRGRERDKNLYISIGREVDLEKHIVKISLGKGVGNNHHSRNSGCSDGRDRKNILSSIDYNYLINSSLDLNLYYEYSRYSSLSVGSGYIFNESLYSILSYNIERKSINILNSYNILKDTFISFGYTHMVRESSYRDIYSISIGNRF